MPHCKQVLVRRNSGYDFGSWAHVIRESHSQLKRYEGLLLCNDSVFGPWGDLGLVLRQLDLRGDIDFWGLTASLAPRWHLQSYFILYAQRLVQSSVFEDFWHEIGLHDSKNDVILSYEVGWSELLTALGFRGKALFELATSVHNPTHESWHRLLEMGFPFIKKELIRENPLGVNLDALPGFLAQSPGPWAEDIRD